MQHAQSAQTTVDAVARQADTVCSRAVALIIRVIIIYNITRYFHFSFRFIQFHACLRISDILPRDMADQDAVGARLAQLCGRRTQRVPKEFLDEHFLCQ